MITFKRLALFVIVLVACEQSLLKFYLDKLALRRDAEFMEYIEKVKSRPGGLSRINTHECEYRSLGNWPYKYEMCIYGGFRNRENTEDTFGFSVTTPAGWLTLVPWDYGDRKMIFRVWLFVIDSNGRIVERMKLPS
jgi:hypothetical protein